MSATQQVLEQIQIIKPWDSVEESHQKDSVSWIKSGALIYRIKKPDIPEQHLVSYSVLIDPAVSEILLVEHKNAGLWLPCGGHVEIDEDPKLSAERELFEELNVKPKLLFEKPIFITKAKTVGLSAGHTDVSLWYVFGTDKNSALTFDQAEFHSIKWFKFDDVPLKESDPNMGRFLSKLRSLLFL